MLLIRASLILFLCLMVEQAAGFFGLFKKKGEFEELTKEYDLINLCLAVDVPTEEPVQNLLTAIDYLKVAAGEEKYIDQDPNDSCVIKKDGQLAKALSRFTSLLKLTITADNYCDLWAFNILRANELSTGRSLMVPDSLLGPIRRIDFIVRQVAWSHADQCRPKYSTMFQELMATVDKSEFMSVTVLLDKLISISPRRVFTTLAQRRKYDPRTIWAEKSKGIADISSERQIDEIISFLRSRDASDEDLMYLNKVADPIVSSQWIVYEDRVEKVLNRYVFDDCEKLAERTWHILKPALYEQQLYEMEDQYHAISEEHAELMVWVHYYRICSLIYQNREDINDKIVNYIWTH